MTTYVASSLTPRILPHDSGLNFYHLSSDEAEKTITAGARLIQCNASMRAFIKQKFPQLDTGVVYSEVELGDGDQVVIVSYTGPRLGHDGKPGGPHSTTYSVFEVAL